MIIMHITTILFDLDGTLLPMDQELFVKTYFGLLAAKAAPHGYAPEQLVQTIWTGTSAMVKNNGPASNETVFWMEFQKAYGEQALQDRKLFDEFYQIEFQKAKESCGFQPLAKEIVQFCKDLGLQTVLATNPIFPAVATQSRIRWAGLTPDDFSLYTTYEDFHHSKPNPDYYREILAAIGRSPKECLMVGNDVAEDMVAQTLGMNVFLLTDCLINEKNEDISQYPHGDFHALKEFLSHLNRR